jgi:hypothetical protein
MKAIANLTRMTVALACALGAAQARAEVPSSFSIQGVLRDGGGKLQSTPITAILRFYDAASGDHELIGQIEKDQVPALNGLFTVTVSDPQLAQSLSQSSTGEIWVQVTIGNETFPRQQLTPNLMALMCRVADSAHSAERFSGSLLDVDGVVQAHGLHFTGAGGHTLGPITVLHNAGGTGDLVSGPFDHTEVGANLGRTMIWNATGPHLRDVTMCNRGPSAYYKVETSAGATYEGQYTATYVSCPTGPCVSVTWAGWDLQLSDGDNKPVVGSSAGVVYFTLSWIDGSGWRVEHMNGTVGVTNFECH